MGPKRKTSLEQNIKTPKKLKDDFKDDNSLETLNLKEAENDSKIKIMPGRGNQVQGRVFEMRGRGNQVRRMPQVQRRGRSWSATQGRLPAKCIPDLQGESPKKCGHNSEDETLKKNEQSNVKSKYSEQSKNVDVKYSASESKPNETLQSDDDTEAFRIHFGRTAVGDDLSDSQLSSKPDCKLQSVTEKNSSDEEGCKLESVTEKNSSDEEDSNNSSNSAWEDVEENEDKEPIIPKEGVEITLDLPDALKHKSRKKKELDIEDYFRRKLNRIKKESQLNLHKVHLLCLVAHGIYLNNLLNDELFRCIALSVVPEEFLGEKKENIDKSFMKRFTNWFCGTFQVTHNQSIVKTEGWESLFKTSFETFSVAEKEEAVVIYILLVRTLGLDSRVVISFQPLPLKPSDLIKPNSKTGTSGLSSKKSSSGSTENNVDSETNSLDALADDVCQAGPSWQNDYFPDEEKKTNNSRSNTPKKKSDNKEDHQPLSIPRRRTQRKRTQVVNLTAQSDSEQEEAKDEKKKKDQKNAKMSKARKDSNSDSDFEIQVIKMKTPKTVGGVRKNRRAISSDSEEEVQMVGMKYTEKGLDYWTEVYLETEKKWICINCIDEKIDCYMEMERVVTKPISYIVAFDSQGRVKDVTHRYAENWMSYTRRLRIDADWWEESLTPFHGKTTARDRQEDEDLDNQLLNRPLPMTIAEYKSHPLYALQRHLLKFEAIYPENAIPVGFVRGEPVYSRECVRTLHSRETWLKEAKVVKPGEKPYKLVKARPKWNKPKDNFTSLQQLEIFGEWQTENYEPPTASEGKVPRNEYGNVELFKPCMLPKGTVHLRVPGLNRVAKKLGIDCAPAMIGWDFHGGASHPLFDGWVVCSEFEDTLMDAWRQQEEINKKREKEKYEKRVFGNWRKLIRGLLIREQLKVRYGCNEEGEKK